MKIKKQVKYWKVRRKMKLKNKFKLYGVNKSNILFDKKQKEIN